MPDPAVDPRWPRLLALAVHEFRTPISVVAGYIRMLLKDRAGPLTDQQRRLLEEAEKSCARLSALVSEISDLSNLEAGTAPFNRSRTELGGILSEAIASLPEIPDRRIDVELESAAPVLSVQADPVRLRMAFGSVLAALRREQVTTSRLLVRERPREDGQTSLAWVAIADPDHIDALSTAPTGALATFDEWRGGVGLTLGIARRIFEAHGGRIWAPAEQPKAGAVIALPLA